MHGVLHPNTASAVLPQVGCQMHPSHQAQNPLHHPVQDQTQNQATVLQHGSNVVEQDIQHAVKAPVLALGHLGSHANQHQDSINVEMFIKSIMLMSFKLDTLITILSLE